FRAAADAADDHDLVGRDAQVGQGFLDGGEDGVVAAAGTPRGPVLAVKVFGRDAGGSAVGPTAARPRGAGRTSGRPAAPRRLRHGPPPPPPALPGSRPA